MKSLFLLLIGSVQMVFAESSYSQNTKATLSFTVQDETLENVFRKIEQNSEYLFFYNDKAIDLSQRVSISVVGKEIHEILQQLFKDTDLQYEIADRQIVIYEKGSDRKSLLQSSQQQADRKTIVGVVKDADGSPLPGVTVLIKGTRIGTATDENGRYSLALPDDDKNVILSFSFVGMTSQEVRLANIKDADVLAGKKDLILTLREEEQSLKDLVVTGYADIRKSSFTGTVTQVSKEEVLKVGNQNLLDVLQVFDPSLRVVQNSEMGSDPNTLPELYLRGRSGVAGVKELDLLEAQQSGTLSQYALSTNPNLPVFILDGFEVSVQKIYDLDINRIKGITMLKDAAATARYGSRAANGVIVIETISPQVGQLQVTYIGNYAVTAPDLTSYNLMNAREKLDAEVAAGLYEPWVGISEPWQELLERQQEYRNRNNNILRGVDTYWLSQPLSTMFNHQHSARIEGGNDAIRFGIEGGYNGQNGVMKESFRDRYNMGIDLDYRYKNLQIRNQANYAILKAQDSRYGSFRDYTSKQPYERITDDNGEYVKQLTLASYWTTFANPLYEATLGSFSRNGNNELADNISVNWYPTEHLQVKGQFAISLTDSWTSQFKDPASSDYYTTSLFQNGELWLTETKANSWNFNLFSAYNRVIDLHNINLSAGINAVSNDYQYKSEHYRGFPDAEHNSPAYAATIVDKATFSDNKTRLFGGFLTANYSFRNIYLLDASLRFDGSSEFGSKKKWGSFWSFGTGLNLHNYEFAKSINWLSMLRITGNIGQTGRINFQPYQARNTFVISLDNWYPTGIGASLKGLGNENLTWETQTGYNLQAEIGALNDRYHLKVDVYRKETSNQVTEMGLPYSSGFTSYTENAGTILNAGYELDMKANFFHSRDWDITLFGNLAHNHNEILELSDALKRYNDRIVAYFEGFYGTSASDSPLQQFASLRGETAYEKPYMQYEEGNSLTTIYGMKSLGINPADGKEVFVKRDGTITDEWLPEEQQKIGDTEPWAQGAFGVNARYKQFSLYTSFLYEFGGDLYNETLVTNVENINLIYYNADRRVLTDRWQKPGDVSPLKSIQDRVYITRPTSRFVQKNNYLKFNSISLSYDVSREWLKKFNLSMLRLQFNMKDIATLSTIKREMGLSYPYARTFTFSINASF
ncbi:MAG: SusC/RagA family TonB-linked outer membrane protein [Dysgonamonadaceae bacterium]|jgi:TonB-linked SusC/RagA family outer membrane protein|nr:SusC/RagA family TonB-linked outer membrane protein [Dysgonamonadaceae bacterium]